MSVFTKTANDIFAPHEASGSSRSVNNQDAQVWGTEVERMFLSFQAGGGILFASKAAADATLTYPANQQAWVMGDAIVANNGVYRKVGASGAGSWVRVGDLPYSFITAADAGAGTANAIQATTSIPVSASALILLNIFETNTSSPVTVSFNGSSALTIKTNSGNDPVVAGLPSGMIVVGVVSGSTFRLVSDLASAAIVAAAEAAQAAAEAAAAEAVSLVGAAASAVQPPHINLTPTQTGSAIQSIVNEVADNGGRVQLKRADYSLSAPIGSGARAIRYEGAGNLQTRLIANTAGASVIEHGLVSQTYFASLSLENININSSVNRPKRGIDAIFDRNSGIFELRDIRFSSFSADSCFEEYIRATGATNTKMWNVVCTTGSNSGNTPAERDAATQVGFHFLSHDNDDKSYVYEFNSCSIDANNMGIFMEVLGNPGDSGSLEGIIATNCLGRTNIGPWFKLAVPNSKASWHPPFFKFIACNWQGSGAFAHFDSVSNLEIAGGQIYVDAALSVTGGGTTLGLNTIQIEYGKHIIIENNVFELIPDSKAAYLIRLLAGCDNVIIRNNTFVYPPSGSSTFDGGILVDPSVTNFQHYGNQFKNWPGGKPKIWNGTSEIPARFETSASGANFLINGLTALNLQGGGAIANFLQFVAATTGFGPLINAAGTDANVPLNLQAKGAAPISALSPLRIPTFTVSTLPSAAIYAQCVIYVSNGTSSKRQAISDGASWRWPDGAVVS
ncbi:hypothetical protein ASD52_06655 [Ensifer sp. Root142]|uniref:hypothetical protein n=1 Tax=Ensifer sp. Root142 TaxID=1736461 RepID=UPI0007096B59|nr:hypothetical protein [Ensifer sp. Root142]KQY71356.1 hypothetical protein ASD52_06655 [Ensifer sp. Root142]